MPLNPYRMIEVILHEQENWTEVFIDGERVHQNHSVSADEMLKLIGGREHSIIQLYSDPDAEDDISYREMLDQINEFNDKIASGERPPLLPFTTVKQGQWL